MIAFLALALAHLAATAGVVSRGESIEDGVQAEIEASKAGATAGRLEIGQCEPPGLPHAYVSPEQRQETKRRVRASCKSVGATPIICAWVGLSAKRESSYRPGVRHNRGPGEDGIGVLGLDKNSQRRRWPGDPEPAWCTPEASVLVALAIARSAVEKWGATSVSDIQAVFAFRTFRDEDGQLRGLGNSPRHSRRAEWPR